MFCAQKDRQNLRVTNLEAWYPEEMKFGGFFLSHLPLYGIIKEWLSYDSLKPIIKDFWTLISAL